MILTCNAAVSVAFCTRIEVPAVVFAALETILAMAIFVTVALANTTLVGVTAATPSVVVSVALLTNRRDSFTKYQLM